jgi:enoyl-CoA hydratase/carnithine racemase
MGRKGKIQWEVKENIGFVTLADEPENSMDTQFFHELHELTSEVIPVAKIKAVIISGKGRHFSSGADLEDLQRTIRNEPDEPNFLMSNYHSFRFFDELEIPVIMAIKGICLGAGLELALHGHFRLCAEGALLGLPESTFNLIPGAGGIEKMVELAGKAKAMELILRGNSFTAKEALEMGIVDAVFSKKILEQKAIELAKRASVNYRKYNKKDYLKEIM